MRLIFSNYDDVKNPFYGGGGALAIHEVARRLALAHEVTVVTGRYPGCRNEVTDGVVYNRVGTWGQSPKFGQLTFHFSLPRQVRTRKFDVWVESLTPPFSTACLQLFTPRPVALLTQNLPGKGMTRKYKLPFHWFERAGLKTYRHGIALSEPIRRELLDANPTMRVAVIPNGVNKSLIYQAVENRPEYILFLGRLDIHQKGLDLLLCAFAEAGGRLGLALAIAGSGTREDERALAATVRRLGLSERVRFLGKVDSERKAAAFRGASMLVMPSRYEGFPLTLLEAFCWNVPALIFAIPELAWLPDSCCAKVPPFSVQEFASAMVELANNPGRRQSMAHDAKQWVKVFDWDTIAESYANFFATLKPA